MTTWIPFRDYTGYHHVLSAAPACVHPTNGNIYYWACEQQGGARQNLAIYREVAKTGAWERVVEFEGTIDAQSFITPGGCVIGQGGGLNVATSLVPKNMPYVTETGFQGVRCRIPGVDEPWGDTGLATRFASLEQRLDAIETALGTLSTGGLDAGDREALDRLRVLCGV